MNKWYSHISIEQDQLQNRQFLSLLPCLYYPCLDNSEICGLQCKADNFAIIIVRPLLHATIFVFFLSVPPNSNCSKQGEKALAGSPQWSRLKENIPQWETKGNFFSTICLQLSPTHSCGGWGGSRQNQKHAVCYKAGYHFWNNLRLSLYLLMRSISAWSLLLRSKFRLFSKISSIWSGQRKRVLFSLMSSSAKHIQSAPGHCSA